MEPFRGRLFYGSRQDPRRARVVAQGASRIKEDSTDGQMMRLAYLKYATALAGKD
ncbi:MAG: hypothetical protein QF645_01200 [Planctomycetota bacterium]|nr:hypothetical protein [Planctomycetota bacterium]